MAEPEVLTIIVTYNKKNYVANLLESLKEIDYRNYDIVVVDNASTDGTVEYLKEYFPYITVIANNENLGGSGGFNTGLRYAYEKDKYKYYWLLDNDVVVSKDALKHLVDTLEKHEDIAVAGSQMCQLDNPEVTNEVGAYVDFSKGCLVLNRHLTRKRNNSAGIFDVDYVAAASLLVRAEVAKKAGLWEDFFIHFDDVDWCLTIGKMNHRIVGVAESVIWHLSAAEKPITWQQYYDARNMLYLLNKHASWKNVARFGRRKCLQAVYTELKGFTPVAEIILNAIDDFYNEKKGKGTFTLPKNIDDNFIKKTHPATDVLVCYNEWFDIKKFPFEEGFEKSIKALIYPDYLFDAGFYLKRLKNMPFLKYGRARKLFYLAIGLLGYRRYKRAYVDIRYMPFVSILSNEIIVKINDDNWLIKRDRLTVWKSFFNILRRSAGRYLFYFLINIRKPLNGKNQEGI